MTFDDEFNSFTSSADGSTGTWMTNYPWGGENAYTLTPNDEKEYYSSDTTSLQSPFKLSNGVLDITATQAAAGSNPYNLPYTSGLITTYKSFSQLYGYFEVSAKLPAGQGLWPAFWMLPADNSTPVELDIFEMLGYDPTTIHSTTHGWDGSTNVGLSQAFSVANTSTAFHTYGVDWEPKTVTFYMDGVALGSAATPKSMNVPMYMLVNLAVGGAGSWGGAADSTTPLPATMGIDYVHAYATAATTTVAGSAAITVPSTATSGVATSTGATGAATTGTGTTGTGTTGTVLSPVVLGSGSHVLALQVSEDAYKGDAQFTVSVDGTQVGGIQTATASHAAGSSQEYDIKGSFAAGTHTVSVAFLNDAYGGSPTTDRNLYVTSATLDGTGISGAKLTETITGAQSFSFQQPTDTLTLGVSEDAYGGDAQYRVLVDGYYVDGTFTATASHAAGLINQQTISGSWGKGAHTVAIQFINDLYGGTPATDRNLYVNSVAYDGTTVTSGTIAQYSNGVAYIPVPATGTTTSTSTTASTGTNANTLTLNLSEDAYKGDAQFNVSVDGTLVNTAATVTASHAAGATQAFSFTAGLSAGTHDIGLTFLNDLYGGSPATDRNLYITGASLNGTALNTASWTAALNANGTDHFKIVIPS